MKYIKADDFLLQYSLLTQRPEFTPLSSEMEAWKLWKAEFDRAVQLLVSRMLTEPKEEEKIVARIKEIPIMSAHSADVTEVKHGHWIEEEYSTEDDWGVNNYHYHICSECHEKISNTDFSKRWICCPYCGADMRERGKTG